MVTFTPQIRSTTPGAFLLNGGMSPRPGYKLSRVRGRGGFAEVWEAESPHGPVALKFMLSSNTSTTARELRSVQSLMALHHPNLVTIHDVFTVPGYVVVAMELAEASLLDLMVVYHDELGQPIEPKTLGLYLWQVADALDFLNARRHTQDGRRVGFQHGDVKPNNVLLYGDVAKLTDYGLATPTYGPTTPCPRHGTREYSSPEVFQGYQTESSDQFSLAMTYCVLRTGKFPFPPPGPPSKTFRRPPPDLSPFNPHEQAALARALSPTPQDRFPGCRDFMTAILKGHGLKAAQADGVWSILPDDPSSIDTPRSKLIVGHSTPRK